MTDEEALFNAVCTGPDEDTPRLIYADWLDEQGDYERAAFIRLHCAWSADPGNRELWTAWEEVRERIEPRLRAELPNIPGLTWGAFQRGFIEEATLAGNWLGFASAVANILRRVPLQWVRVTSFESVLRPLNPPEPMRDFASLFIRSLAGFRRMLGSERRADADKFETLAANLRRGRYTALDLSELNLTDTLLERLLEQTPEAWSYFSVLDLGYNPVTDRGLQRLVRSPYFQRVRGLNLSGTEITAIGLAELARTPEAARLHVLHLQGLGVTDAGVQALAESPFLKHLIWLKLTGHALTTAGENALAQSSNFSELLELNGFPTFGTAALRRRFRDRLTP